MTSSKAPISPRGPRLTRASFLRGAAAAAAVPFTGFHRAESLSALGLTEVAPGVFVHQGHHALFSPENEGDIANCGIVIGRDAVAVIDTGGSAHVGTALRQSLRAITDRPITYVINTHMHPDHVFGNAAFAADAPAFVGHHKLARGLAARAERYLAVNRELLGEAAFEGTRIVLPTLAVTDRTVIDLGGRTLVLQAHPTAHTDNDLTVRDEATGTVFMGDLLFCDHIPTLDGSITGWLSLMDVLAGQPAERVVPGHGPASMPWPDAVRPLQRYFQTVAADVRALIEAGASIADAPARAGQSEKDAWQLFDDYHGRNVTAAFKELEWE